MTFGKTREGGLTPTCVRDSNLCCDNDDGLNHSTAETLNNLREENPINIMEYARELQTYLDNEELSSRVVGSTQSHHDLMMSKSVNNKILTAEELGLPHIRPLE